MFDKFFGFTEQPFKLVPDPNYLFLSKSHEDALAHLEYAISGADGFVEIVGEVGTGKTTICRAFLDRLADSVEVAYIFNPVLDSLQLMKVINSEFGIDSRPDNTKDLIDILNIFLLQCKSDGKTVLVLIDEAQNLSADVLEQLRLLSNLETTREKLIKIVLVGQPELDDLLARHDLRQLRQRISLCCQLQPLNFSETCQYVVYRIQRVSSGFNIKIEKAALRKIHKFSGGVPRLINIAANRMLLTAYSLNSRVITRGIAALAIKELRHRRIDNARVRSIGGRQLFFAAALMLLVSLVGVYFLSDFPSLPATSTPRSFTAVDLSESKREEGDSIGSRIEELKKVPREKFATNAEAEYRREAGLRWMASAEEFGAFLDTLDHQESRQFALETALRQWKDDIVVRAALAGLERGMDFFNAGAGQNGFELSIIRHRLDILEKLQVPAVFAMYTNEGTGSVYLNFIGWHGDTDKLVLTGLGRQGGETLVVSKEILRRYWTGVAYLPWIDFLKIRDTIPLNSEPESVYMLKTLLADSGFAGISLDSVYDARCEEIIKNVQGKYNLTVDGLVGPLTKIALYRENRNYVVPILSVQER